MPTPSASRPRTIAVDASAASKGPSVSRSAKREMPLSSTVPSALGIVAARRMAACCKPAPTSMIGHSCIPSWRARRVRRSSTPIAWISSTATSRVLPCHSPPRLERTSMALIDKPKGVARCAETPTPAIFAPVKPPASSAICLAARSSPPRAWTMLAKSASGFAKSAAGTRSAAIRWSSFTAAEPNCDRSCVLPTPWTPSTSTIPPCGSRVLRMYCSRSCSTLSSLCRPAK